MSQEPIRVLIADDHPMFRRGVKALLATIDDIEVVGEAIDGLDAIEKAETLAPDMILLDLVMPRMDGITAMRQILKEHPNILVFVLTSFANDDKVLPAIRAGAMGYLLKDSGPEELVQAIRQVHRGEPSLHPSVARAMLREMAAPPTKVQEDESLTEREVAVLRLVARGLRNQDIADHLLINETTVRTHVRNILAKLHLESRTQAALYALREGLASLDELDSN